MKMNNKIFKSKNFIPIAVLAMGILLLVIPYKSEKNNNTEKDADISYYTQELEGKVSSLLLAVEGIDEVKVLITLENIGEQVLAENKSSSSTEYVIVNNGETDEGIKLTEIYPVVRGVAVVCTNGNDIAVKEKVTSLLSSALGIPTNRITVVG